MVAKMADPKAGQMVGAWVVQSAVEWADLLALTMAVEWVDQLAVCLVDSSVDQTVSRMAVG